jgi:hypothetical protein
MNVLWLLVGLASIALGIMSFVHLSVWYGLASMALGFIGLKFGPKTPPKT